VATLALLVVMVLAPRRKLSQKVYFSARSAGAPAAAGGFDGSAAVTPQLSPVFEGTVSPSTRLTEDVLDRYERRRGLCAAA
jgi:hypothetical protein